MTDRHIVVTGQARSGSTLFFNMLHHTLKNFTLQTTEASALTLLEAPGNTCTKRPLDIFDIPSIITANRGRKRLDLIVTLRDPRDILTSRHKSVPDDYFCGADHSYFVMPDRAPQFVAPGLLPTHRAIVEVLNANLFPQGIFLLKYEHLIEDPDRIQRMLAEGLGLGFEGSFRDFHTGAIPEALQGPLNGVRSVDWASVAKWRAPEHRKRIIDQFTRFPELHDVMEALGYEEDRGWFDDFVAEGRRSAAVPSGPATPKAEARIPDLGSIIDHPAIPVVYEDEEMKVTALDGEGSHCLVTFVGVGHGLGGVDRQSEEFRKCGPEWGPQLFVFDKRRSWGNSLDLDRLAQVTAPYREGRSVVSMGLSMGGFLAIHCARALGAECCIAFAPQFSVHPEIAPFDRRWERYASQIGEWRVPSLKDGFAPGCRYYAFFPDNPVEQAHMALFPQSGDLTRFVVADPEHNVALTMKQAGVLYPAIAAFIRGDAPDRMPFAALPQAGVWRVPLEAEGTGRRATA